MSHKLKVTILDDEHCFFALLDECGPGGFSHNRVALLKSFCQGCMYVVASKVPNDIESPCWARCKNNILPKFYKDGDWYHILPCFCTIYEENCCGILWVHPRIRKKGVARKLLKDLEINSVSNVLKEAIPFWDKFPHIKQKS